MAVPVSMSLSGRAPSVSRRLLQLDPSLLAVASVAHQSAAAAAANRKYLGDLEAIKQVRLIIYEGIMTPKLI